MKLPFFKSEQEPVFCIKCKHMSKSPAIHEHFAYAVCLASPKYDDYVEGKVNYYYCSVINHDGKCKLYQEKPSNDA